MRPSLLQHEIEFLEILNGERNSELQLFHVMHTEALVELELLERIADEEGRFFVRVSPLGESWLAFYHGRLN